MWSLLLSAMAHGDRNTLPHSVPAIDGGTTYLISAKHAPFPDGIHPDRDRSVIFFVPDRLKEYLQHDASAAVDVLVYFHGHERLAVDVIAESQLREMLLASKQRTLLVVPQLAHKRRSSHAGRLQRRNGLRKLLTEVLEALYRDVGFSGRREIGRVILAAHSGGFQAAAFCAERGGVSVHEVYLFDALYGFTKRFLRWFRSTPGARFVSYSTGDRLVEKWTRRLQQAAQQANISYLADRTHQSLKSSDWRSNRMIFLNTREAHARVPYAFHALRDLLLSSSLQPQAVP